MLLCGKSTCEADTAGILDHPGGRNGSAVNKRFGCFWRSNSCYWQAGPDGPNERVHTGPVSAHASDYTLTGEGSATSFPLLEVCKHLAPPILHGKRSYYPPSGPSLASGICRQTIRGLHFRQAMHCMAEVTAIEFTGKIGADLHPRGLRQTWVHGPTFQHLGLYTFICTWLSINLRPPPTIK